MTTAAGSVGIRRPESPDVETSSDGYARRFSGSVGSWFLEIQARGVIRLLAPLGPCRVVDVGGGHAQLAGPLRAAGHEVIVVGGDPCCAERLRRSSPPAEVPFVCAALDRLPFPDGGADVIVSVRTMAHVAEPARFLQECARVARRAVLIDYATTRSLNTFAGLLFALKRKIERDTRPYRCLAPSEPDRMISARAFRPARRIGQFFWPMALHRAHRRRWLARALEYLPRRLGLARLFGSPVLALYRAESGGL